MLGRARGWPGRAAAADEVGADAVEDVDGQRPAGAIEARCRARASRLGHGVGVDEAEEELASTAGPTGCRRARPRCDRKAGHEHEQGRAGRRSGRSASRASMPAMALTHAGDQQDGHRLAHDPPQALGRATASPTTRHDRATPPRARRRATGRDDRDAEQDRGQAQGGQGEHVAEGRHERGGHVVEVPAVADRAGGQAERWPPARRPSRAARRRSRRWPGRAARSCRSSPRPTATALATTASDQRDAER